MKISLIVAVANNGTIGRDNKIPWVIPGEQKLFKEYTKGKAVVMGRLTWESLPVKFRPLPDRLNIVLSRSEENFLGAIKSHSIEEAITTAENHGQSEVVFIGGESVYNEVINRCDTLYISVLEKDFDGDRKFPPLVDNQWSLLRKDYFPKKEDMECGYHFMVMQRI